MILYPDASLQGQLEKSWIKEMYMKDREQEEKRVDAICRAYGTKIEMLKKWQTAQK